MLFTTGSILAADEANADADGAVCYIGDNEETGTKYKTLKAAIEGAGDKNVTIHLVTDVLWEEMIANQGADFTIDGTNKDGENYKVTLLGNITVLGYSNRAYFSNVTIDLSGYHFKVTGLAEMELKSGAVFENGYDSLNGGGAAFVESSTFTMNEGSLIKNCEARTDGGAVRLNGATFTMNGGKIESCKAGRYGGAVAVKGDASKVDLTGGEISGNTAVNGGGGVYVDGAADEKGKVSKVNASGSINISGNTLSDNTTVNNMEVTDVSSLEINGNITETGNIGLTFTGATRGTEIGTVTNDVTDLSKIKYDNSDYIVDLSEGKLVLKADYVCYVGDDEAMGKKYKSVKEAIEASADKDVTIVLVKDTTWEAQTYNNGADFVLNGANRDGNYTLTLLGDITVSNYSNRVYFENINVDLNQHHIVLSAQGEMTLRSGAVLKNGYSEKDGGAVYVGNACKLTMQEGSIIQDCKAKQGGAIRLNGSTMTMTGGKITNCEATDFGGAIGVAYDSTLNITGGSITGNKAPQGAGICTGVHSRDKSVTNVSGGVIVSGNTLLESTAANNIQPKLATNLKVNGTLTGKIGVTVASASEESVLGVVEAGITSFENSNTVSYDEDGYIIYIDGTDLRLAVKPALTIQVDSGSYSDKTGVIRFLTTFNGISGAAVEKYGTYALATDNFNIESDETALTKFVEFTATPGEGKAYVVDVVDIPEDKFGTKIAGVSFIKIKGIDTPFYIPYAECVSVNSINPEVKNLGDKVSE